MGIILINEFKLGGSPVALLVWELYQSLLKKPHLKPHLCYVSKRYRPGGLQPGRIFNCVLMHLFLPLYLLFFRIRYLGKPLILIPTTNPPLIHWTCIIIGKLIRADTVVWYQDAHPDLEIMKLNQLGWLRFLSPLLRIADRAVLRAARVFVVLDNAMRLRLRRKSKVKDSQIRTIHPWATFAGPALAMKRPKMEGGQVNVIYSGNYGAAHDLTPMVQLLSGLPPEKQSRFIFTFVGMNAEARTKLEETFWGLSCAVRLLPRFEKFSDLLDFYAQFDFGLVSLSESMAGVACPSKAFTYIARGLPILYSGPANTLTDDLCKEGWGIRVNEAFLTNLDMSTLTKCDQTFPDPAPRAYHMFDQILGELHETPR